MENYLNFSFNVSVWGKIYKKNLIGDTRFPELNINEDFIFLWEIVKKTKCFCENLNVNYIYYLDKPVSLSKAPFSEKHMSMIAYVDKVLKDTKTIFPDLFSVALNHHNACILHTLILYYNYITSPNIKKIYSKESSLLIDRAKKIEKITSFLLLHEANYNIRQTASAT